MKFLLMRTYGLEEDVVLRISRCLFSGSPSLISKWNDRSNSGSSFCLEDSHHFMLKRKYGLEDFV